MAGRPKTPTRELQMRDDAVSALRDLLTAQIELEAIQGQMDLARAAATAKFEKYLDAKKLLIDDLTEQLHTWYLVHGHPADGRKSIDLTYGVIGERTSPPALKPLNRKWNWKAIAAKLMGTHGSKYFHPAADPAVDKDRVRAELNEDQLRACGLKVEQEEVIYIELDRASLVVQR
jgi:hypothetical protein